MSTARYLRLRAALAAVRSSGRDSYEEDDLLGEMDEEWSNLTDAERQEVDRLAEPSDTSCK